jgi:plasmid maintenance system killer protein
MHIASIRHKGLRQLYEDDNAKGVQSSLVDKLKKLLLAIETADGLDDLDLLDYH